GADRVTVEHDRKAERFGRRARRGVRTEREREEHGGRQLGSSGEAKICKIHDVPPHIDKTGVLWEVNLATLGQRENPLRVTRIGANGLWGGGNSDMKRPCEEHAAACIT